MPQTRILQEGKSYTFRSYFEMPYETDNILAEFGFALQKARLTLPSAQESIRSLTELQQRIEETLLLTNLSSESARREALVFPVLLEVARICQTQIRIEYALTVNDWLKGSLDYLLQNSTGLVVVEAKNDDMTRGFTQLAVELIALAQVEQQDVIYGAVTMGDAWRFGKLDKIAMTIYQDIALYRVPDDLELLTRILTGILQSGDG